MMSVATAPALTCEKLVAIENEVDEFKRSGIKHQQDKHTDILKWISITLYGTFYPLNEDDLVALH